MNKIRISAAQITLSAELADNITAQEIWEHLPLEANVNVWGDEIYFEIPPDIPLQADARSTVPVGTLGYWPPGRAFCIFFGPTPVSVTDEPQAASPVNIFGRIKDDATLLRGIAVNTRIRIERLENNISE